jgi:hypothetical protein
MSVERPVLCDDCRLPLAPDQRYCLACGARVGSRGPQLEELLLGVRGRAHGASVPAQSAAAPVAAASAVPPVPTGLKLPPPRVSALLVLVFLGFGVLLGNVAGSRVNDTLASARSHVKIVLPASGPSSTSTSTSTSPSATSTSESSASTPESSASASASAPPSSESEPTPTPAASNSAPAAKAPSGSSGTSTSTAGEGGSSKTPAGGPASKLPPVKHVFVVMLSDQPYAAVFGPESSAPYLSQTLEQQGELLVRYDAVVHEELANEAALLSGQGPTGETAANCPNYADITPATIGADEQVLGSGCVYPTATQTLAGQLTAKHLTWRAYVEGMDEAEAGAQAGACSHPALGQADPTSAQTSSGGPYATFRNPFVYFDSVIDSPACAADDVGLDRLKSDLAAARRTPSFSYIVPDRCHDGNPTPCAAGAPAGLAPADGFLKTVVPEIMGSKAYKQGGLLVITVDEAPSSGEFADSSSCCGQPQFPNLPAPPTGLSPRGGGTVGALLLSPFVKAGTTSQEPYNHFSLLRTIEDLFALKHLGYAGLSAVKSFEPSMFSAGAKG